MKKASVTIYFALLSVIMIPLILMQITSVKVSAGRMQAANSMDQALFSLFGHYDSVLVEEYGLLFLNAGGGGSGPDLEAVITECEEAMDYILQPTRGIGAFSGKSLLSLQRKQFLLSAYTLATDAGGAPFRAQAIQCARDTVGIEAISLLKAKMADSASVEEGGSALLSDAESVDANDIEDLAAEAAGSDYEAEESETDIPEDFVNPLPVLEQLRSFSVLDLVVSDPERISGEASDPELLPSGRSLAAGIGVIDTAGAGSESDLLFKAWIATHFGDYTAPSSHSAFRLQKEYLLAGKKSDRENLKAVVTKLLLAREAVNIFCLLKDPVKSPELTELSFTIAAFLAIPEAEPLIKLALAAAWAYAESLVDVRALLEGKRVPYIKDAASWQTDAEGLAQSGGDLTGLGRDHPGGMRYSEFLDALLLASSGEHLTMRSMDLVESRMRGLEGENFCLDACIAALSAEALMEAEHRVSFEVERSVSYMEL